MRKLSSGDEVTDSVPGVCNQGSVSLSLLGNIVTRFRRKKKTESFKILDMTRDGDYNIYGPLGC